MRQRDVPVGVFAVVLALAGTGDAFATFPNTRGGVRAHVSSAVVYNTLDAYTAWEIVQFCSLELRLQRD